MSDVLGRISVLSPCSVRSSVFGPVQPFSITSPVLGIVSSFFTRSGPGQIFQVPNFGQDRIGPNPAHVYLTNYVDLRSINISMFDVVGLYIGRFRCRCDQVTSPLNAIYG